MRALMKLQYQAQLKFTLMSVVRDYPHRLIRQKTNELSCNLFQLTAIPLTKKSVVHRFYGHTIHQLIWMSTPMKYVSIDVVVKKSIDFQVQ